MTDGTAQSDRAPMRGVGPALLWACFLGSSWTWVIGMLLPALLLRDFGLWGWVVFAIPNVIGAAAMGLVIATPARSRVFVKNHREAALRFSEITIAFHVFAVGAIYQRLFGEWGLLAAGAVLIFVFMAAQYRVGMLGAAVVVTAASLIAFAVMAGHVAGENMRVLPTESRLGVHDLLLFAPASLVGFALCPYLDLTFHRARQQTSTRTGVAAFAIGFGVVFLLMIVFSIVYSNAALDAFSPFAEVSLGGFGALVLGAHLTLQAGFTSALHLREVAERRGHVGLHRIFMLAIAAGALAWWALSEPMRTYYGLSIGEIVYRVFLLFYGLVFPAYVFLCMIPTRRPVAWWPRFAVVLGAALLAAPMGYVGFVVGRSWWIVGALGTLVLARGIVEWMLPRRKPDPKSPAI